MVGTDREDPVRSYLTRIAAVPLLTAADEVELAKRIETGVYAAELLSDTGKGEQLPGTRAELAAFEAVEQRALASDLRAQVGTLPRREADAVRMRFGLFDGEPWTLREIGNRMGLSPEGARLLVRRGVARLRRTVWTGWPLAA